MTDDLTATHPEQIARLRRVADDVANIPESWIPKMGFAGMYPPNWHNQGVGGMTSNEIMREAVHGPTHTATVVIETSRVIYFTPRDGESVYETFCREMERQLAGAHIVRHSEPRER